MVRNMKKLLNEAISNNLSHVHSKTTSSEHILVPKMGSDMETELVAEEVLGFSRAKNRRFTCSGWSSDGQNTCSEKSADAAISGDNEVGKRS